MSTINVSLLRFDNFIQLLDTSSVIIGRELVFLNLCSIISEDLLILSFQKNLDLLVSESRRGSSLTFEISDPNSSKTGLLVLKHDRRLTTNLRQESDKLCLRLAGSSRS